MVNKATVLTSQKKFHSVEREVKRKGTLVYACLPAPDKNLMFDFSSSSDWYIAHALFTLL